MQPSAIKQVGVRINVKLIKFLPVCMENCNNERLSGILRQEVLDAGWFLTTKQAQTAINIWPKQHNHIRPYQALDTKSPVSENLFKDGS